MESEADRLYLAGIKHLEAGDLGAAMADLEAALGFDPDHLPAVRKLVELCLEMDEIRAFGNWIYEYLRLDPLSPEPHILLAEHLATHNRWDEVLEELARAETKSPSESQTARMWFVKAHLPPGY